MPVANAFAQYDVDLQAMIAEIHAEVQTIAPPVAAMGRRSFLKLAGFAGGGLVLAFNLDTRVALAAEGHDSTDRRDAECFCADCAG